MKLSELEFHTHQCRKCKAVMRHWSQSGCNMDEKILCDTCSNGTGFLADERKDKNKRRDTQNR